MELNLRELTGKTQPLHLSEQLDIADIVKREPSIHSADKLLAEIDAVAELDSSVIVSGRVEGKLELICSRCLKVFPYQLSFQFEEVFQQGTDPDEDDELEETRFINYVEEDKVDLNPYVKENITLELPRFPLCDTHCRGLCPTCGCNRNTEACACNETTTDPRWSGLKDLFQP